MFSAVPKMTAELPAIVRSPATGGKRVNSRRERLSSPCLPPVDAPKARQFRLSYPSFGTVTCLQP
jgi:hypothetical protein